MIIKRFIVVFFVIILSAITCNADDLTTDKLYGTWQITREDGSNPFMWEEFYKFNKDGTLDYMGNNNSRNYKFEINNGSLIIHRESGPLIRTIKEYEGDKIILFDKTLEILLILTKKN